MSNKLIKTALIFFIPIFLFIFLSTYNLSHQYSFNGDPARDTLQSLRILRSHDITFIGPPLSLGQNGTRETYFSSLIYYIGAFMLLISHNSVFALVFIIALINASAIIPLILFLKKRNVHPTQIVLAVSLYITNPTVITYSRIFWNPSPLIGLGIWGIFTLEWPILFGLISGVSLYFHYMAVLLFLFGICFYSIHKQWKNILFSLGSFTVTLFPFLFFEMRNQFYLTQSFIFNLTKLAPTTLLSDKLRFFLEFPTSLLGLTRGSFSLYLIQFNSWEFIVGIMLWIVLIWRIEKLYLSFFIITALFTGLASSDYLRVQYAFIAMGVLFMCFSVFKSKVGKSFMILLIAIQLVNTIFSINQLPMVFTKKPFPEIKQLEQMNNTIKSLHMRGNTFNVTENITGDARAMYMRFFVERDSIEGLQDELHYENLKELYVLTPSIQKTVKENRFEFYATPHMSLSKKIPVGSFFLLQYKTNTHSN